MGCVVARNKRVWEGKHITSGIMMDMSLKQILDWKTYLLREKKTTLAGGCIVARHVVKCESPMVGWLKLNVDASVFSEATSFSVGMVLRDDQENFFFVVRICG